MITENTVSSDEVEIEAPAALVWQVLVDFPRYGEWNTFCPRAEATLAIEAGLCAEDLALTVHTHPTLAETVMEAAEDVHGLAIHIYNPK